MNKKCVTYKTIQDFSFDQFIKKINESFYTKLFPSQNTELLFHDTYDWRLYSTSLVLNSVGKIYYLRKLNCNRPLAICKTRKIVKNASDFQECTLKNSISRIIEERVLFCYGIIFETSIKVEILDEHKNIVSILTYFEYRTSAESGSCHSCIQLEQGNNNSTVFYELDYLLGQQGLEIDKESDNLFFALKGSDRSPGDYNSKPSIKLENTQNAISAIKIIVNQLLRILEWNKNYLLDDNDPEFLHDVRVACRLLKSVLSNQDVLIESVTNDLKKDITAILKTTNELRDLDVYLRKREYYKSLLPKNYQPKINFLFTYLRRRKSLLRKRLQNQSISEKIDSFTNKWNNIQQQENEKIFSSQYLAIKIKALAQIEILNNFKQVLRTGKLIVKTKNLKKLHKLRIQCKNLRYLLDVYKSLFPKTKTSVIIKQLKTLQNNLGEYNDLSVQEKYLAQISSRFSITNKNSHDSFIAIGILIGLLHQKKTESANKFYLIFKSFSNQSFKKRFEELFFANEQ